MTFDGRILTTLVMLVLFAGASALALGLPDKAAFMPLLVGIPGTILCAAQLVLDLMRGREPDEPEAPAGKPPSDAGRTEGEIFLWFALFSAAIFGFGFNWGAPVIVGLFVRFSSRESWPIAIFAAIGTAAVTIGIFGRLLGLPLFDGLVLEALF